MGHNSEIKCVPSSTVLLIVELPVRERYLLFSFLDDVREWNTKIIPAHGVACGSPNPKAFLQVCWLQDHGRKSMGINDTGGMVKV